MHMKVVAINSSPKMDKGNTALILGPFLDGMREAGAEVELFYTKTLKINPCQSDYNCWFKTPGKCSQQDDMQMLLPKIGQADTVVLATPVFVDGVSGPVKNLMERLLPLAQPFVELRDGHCRHPRREGATCGQMALVSNCGFWELDNFDPLLAHMKAVCRNFGAEFAGALLRPHGPALAAMLQMGMPVADILAAAQEAGRQLVQEGTISPETLAVVSRELVPRDMYLQIGNQRTREMLEALAKEEG
jgi:multimeric flavodoxin WrbA